MGVARERESETVTPEVVARAGGIYRRWLQVAPMATREQRDGVGMAYMREVLGVSEETVRAFVAEDYAAYDEVGRRQSGIPGDTETAGFWAKAGEFFPEGVSQADIDFLTRHGGAVAAVQLVWILESEVGELSRRSGLLQKLGVNAHAYK